MKINMQSNLGAVAERVRELGNRLPYVTATALTRSAKDGQQALKAEMPRVFDRPTRFAINGTFLKAATATTQEARVWVKDSPWNGTPADRFLLPQIYGGTRRQKVMEQMLQRAGLMPSGWFAVPAAGAQLDSYGNVRRGQITQMLSQLQVQRMAGYESRRSNSAASKRTVARQGVTYFALPAATSGLKPGIYLKRKFGHGTAIRPVFLFVQRAQYRPRLRFHEVVGDAAKRAFPRHFKAQADRVIAVAKLR